MIAGKSSQRGGNRIGKLAFSTTAAALIAGVGLASGSGGGGVGAPDPPRAKDVSCLKGCLDIRTVAETGKVKITGRDLDRVERVRFKGAEGRINQPPAKVSGRRVKVKVPRGAKTGKPIVVDEFGSAARVPVKLEVEPASRVMDAGEFKLSRVDAKPRKTFFKGKRTPKVDYSFEADGPADVRIDVQRKSGKVVDSIVKRDQEPFANQSVKWNGMRRGGKLAPNGKYKFKVSPLSGGRSRASGFRYYTHIFPLRGAHGYGDGLGAGRGHEGQDVFGKCGKKIVAARAGKVQTRAYHSAAGYYIVVDARKTGRDYVYMHMARKGLAKQGARVRTGEVIGRNSDTGNASGCHLHFELHSAPGWYEGGRPISPTKALKRWDGWS